MEAEDTEFKEPCKQGMRKSFVYHDDIWKKTGKDKSLHQT